MLRSARQAGALRTGGQLRRAKALHTHFAVGVIEAEHVEVDVDGDVPLLRPQVVPKVLCDIIV